MAVTSDMDGGHWETVRVHHHLVVPAEAKEAFAEKWAGMGGVDWSPLSAQEDYTPIAAYLIRQVRRVPDAKKYVSSRNLVRPQPKRPGGADRRGTAGTPRAKLLHRNEYKPGRPQYIRYVLPEENGTGHRRAEKPNNPIDPPCRCGQGADVVQRAGREACFLHLWKS